MEKLFEMTDDNARQAQKLENEDVLCFIIRSDIGPFKMHWIASNYYLFSIPYKGNRCLAIAYGMYKNNKISEDPNLHEVDDEIWGDVNDDDDMESELFDEYLEEECCLLIKESLNKIQMLYLKYTYHIIDVVHNGKNRRAIACIVYNKNIHETIEREPEILSQHIVSN